jgi:hypothetical protein
MTTMTTTLTNKLIFRKGYKTGTFKQLVIENEEIM